MRRISLAMALVLAACSSTAALAETLLLEQPQKARYEPVRAQEEDRGSPDWYCSSDLEYGWVEQGDRQGAWKYESLTAGAYPSLKKIAPYLLAESWDRFRDKDYTLNAGAYYRLSSRSSVHTEVGFGLQRDYLYKTLARVEYEDRLAGKWNWTAGWRYLNYPANDVYILSPGLIYYQNDSYLQLSFNDAFTESRGSAQSAQARGFLALTGRFGLYAGAALGQRLYDIYEMSAGDQDGYIGFCGAECRIASGARVRIGYSYSHENPRFIKRGVEAGAFLEF